MKQLTILFILTLFTSACAAPQPAATQIVNIYATPAAGPWLAELYTCAETASVTLNVTPDAPQIILRVGQPRNLSTPAFQIDNEEILIVANRQSTLSNMDLAHVQALFGGQLDPAISVWVYAPGDDIQDIFEQTVMQSRNITSSARVASTPQEMGDVLNNQVNAAGVLPRHWKTGDSLPIYSIGTFPVLAITHAEPQGTVQSLIACLQK